MGFTPTTEQQAVLDAFTTGGNVVVTAAAGAGKTSTMRLLAEANTAKRGLYGAFNKKAQVDAASTFPNNVQCKTSSALARAFVVQQWGIGAWDLRMSAPRQNGRDQAAILGIKGPHRISPDKFLAPQQVARIVMETVERFCHSADERVGRQHVPAVNGVSTLDERTALASLIAPIAGKAWDEVSQPRGYLKFSFDHAMKIWGLSGKARLPFDFVIVDEAQDTNPVWGKIMSEQACQIVVVGDRYQQLYAWRGAVDAMDAFPSNHHLTLSQSFRFGPAIANEANKWLSLLGAEFKVRGFDKIGSRLDSLENPDAVLTRTNAEAISTLMGYQAEGVRAGLVGGAEAIRKLAEAAEQLKETGNTWHPELCAFTSWGALQDYVENDHGGGDLATFVKLIDTYGTQAVIAAAGRSAPPESAELVISTVHKAKGGEWNTVRIADDFSEPLTNDDGTPSVPAEPEMMLAYVAVTRAKNILDRFGLAWVDKYLGGGVGKLENRLGPQVSTITPTIDPQAHFAYQVKHPDGTVLLDWHSNFTDAANVRDSTPGSTLNSKALNTTTAA